MSTLVKTEVRKLRQDVHQARDGDADARERLSEMQPALIKIARRALETGKAHCRIGAFALAEAPSVYVDAWLPEDVKRAYVARKVVRRMLDRVMPKPVQDGTAVQGLLDTVRM